MPLCIGNDKMGTGGGDVDLLAEGLVRRVAPLVQARDELKVSLVLPQERYSAGVRDGKMADLLLETVAPMASSW